MPADEMRFFHTLDFTADEQMFSSARVTMGTREVATSEPFLRFMPLGVEVPSSSSAGATLSVDFVLAAGGEDEVLPELWPSSTHHLHRELVLEVSLVHFFALLFFWLAGHVDTRAVGRITRTRHIGIGYGAGSLATDGRTGLGTNVAGSSSSSAPVFVSSKEVLRLVAAT